MYFDVIKNYYDFSFFRFIDNKNIFICNGCKYYITCFDSKSESFDCLKMSFSVLNCYKPVYNKFHSYITEYKNLFLIVFFINDYMFDSSFLYKPLAYSKKIYLEWRNNWIYKANYIRTFYLSIRRRYPLIDESINYYLGLLDFCIYLLNNYNDYFDCGYIQHKRFLLSEYFNPIYFKIDVKERDFADYLKYLFFSDEYKSINISELIFYGRNLFNYDLVFIRLVFPDYYFDVFDNIILEKENCVSLYTIINHQSSYINYIKKIRKEIEKVYPIKKDIDLIS